MYLSLVKVMFNVHKPLRWQGVTSVAIATVQCLSTAERVEDSSVWRRCGPDIIIKAIAHTPKLWRGIGLVQYGGAV
jgi:hypothetical protein